MAVIKLKIYVPDLSNVLVLFDTIRVWRSESGELGPFFLITADTAEPASLLGTADAPFAISGKTLKLKVDGGAEQTVTFVSPDPVGVALAVEEVNNQTTGLTALDVSGAVQLTSDTTGTDSILEITGGSSLTDLGFTLDQIDNGEDAHIILVPGQDNYEYDDQSGAVAYYYKTQYYNTLNGSFSSLSDAIQGSVGTIVPQAYLITAKIDVADLEGKPVEGMRIVFYNVYTPPLEVSDIAILAKTVEVETNQAGHAEIDLVRGMIVDVTFVGTTVTRRITVPSAGDDFDLISTVSAVDDNFQIQVPSIPDAVRRS
jgi:hypothetical protein